MRYEVPQSIASAIAHLRAIVEQTGLAYEHRHEVLLAVRRAIIPKKPGGRKPDTRLDRAYADYKAGARGLDLLRKHIPNYARLSRWRRCFETVRLRNGIR